MFTAALFTIAKMWKKPKCPWKYEWVKKCDICISQMKYPHTVEYYILHYIYNIYYG